MTLAALSLHLVLAASSARYDSLGRLSSVSAPWGVTGVTWETGGQRLKTLGAESFDYDGRGWLSSVTTPQGVRTYSYDGRGNRLTETMTGGTIQTRHFSYDSADRLVATQEWDGHIEAWALRADGAKQQEKQWAAGTTFSQPFDFATPNPVVTENYTYRTDGTLAAVTNAVSSVVEVGYVHDNNGQVTQRTVGGISTTYGWDVDGRLVTANSSGPGLPTLAATYDYDGLGMRRRAQVSITPINGPPVSTLRTWTWGGSDGEDEVQEDGKVTTHVAGFRVGDGINVFSHDGIGSVVAQDDGANTNEAQFSAWGTRTALGTNFGPLASSAGFTGHRVESALALTYAKRRWLDSSTGTWLSRDDIGAASYLQSPNELNPWLYAASNPTRFTDPSGRDILDLLDPAKPLPKGALDTCSSGGRACPVEEASEGSARAAQQAQKFNSAQPMPSGQPLQQMPVTGWTAPVPSAVAVGVTTVAGVGLSVEQMRAQNKLKAQLNANLYARRCYAGDQEDCAILRKRIEDGDWPQPANPALIPGVREPVGSRLPSAPDAKNREPILDPMLGDGLRNELAKRPEGPKTCSEYCRDQRARLAQLCIEDKYRKTPNLDGGWRPNKDLPTPRGDDVEAEIRRCREKAYVAEDMCRETYECPND